MSLQWNPLVIPLALVGFGSLIGSFRMLRYERIPGAKATALILVASAIWTLGYAIELSSISIDVMLLWDKIQFIGIVVIPTAYLVVVMRTVGHQAWINPIILVLLSIVPVFSLILVFTDPWHHLVWTHKALVDVQSNIYLTKEYGVALWGIYFYSLLVIIVAILILLFGAYRSLIYFRGYIAIMMLAGIAPIIGVFVDVIKVSPWPHLQFGGLLTALISLFVSQNSARIRSGDLASVSHNILVRNFSDAVMVLDQDRCFVDINMKAQNLLGKNRADVLMKNIVDIWPPWLQVGNRITDEFSDVDFIVRDGEVGIYEVSVSPLRDWREQFLGSNVVVRDITTLQRRTDELSALLEISTAVSSTLDLNDVLLTLANKMLEVSGMHICGIYEFEPGSGVLRPLVEHTQAIWSFYADTYSLDEYPSTKHVLTTGEPVIVRKSDTDPEVSWMGEMDLGVVLMLPLWSEDEIIGLVEVGAIDENLNMDHGLISRYQEAIQTAAKWIITPLQSAHGERLVQLAREIVQQDVCTHCTISEWHREGGYVWTVAEYSELFWSPGTGPKHPLEEWPMAAQAIREGTSKIIYKNDSTVGPLDHRDLDIWGAHMVILQPLSIRGEPVGLVELFDVKKERRLSEAQILLWRGLADQAAMAIMNAKLYNIAQQEIKERKRVEAKLRHDAYHDALTGLPNRILLLDRLNTALSRSRRLPETPFAVLFLDIDDFKNVNDRFGHNAGDSLLNQVAERLNTCVRELDTVSRLGGDEFVLLVEDIKDEHHLIYIADRVQECLSSPFNLSDHEVLASASIGIVFGGANYENPEDILRDADIAMYRAKEKGKARFEVFDLEMRERIMNRLRLESDLNRAMDRQELCLHYQPIVALDSNQLVGCEALIRWHLNDGSIISPDIFIPVAEETGIIFQLGRWVIKSACTQLRSWRSEFPGMEDFPISVNISSVEMFHPEFVEFVQQVLSETELGGGSLCLEMTERAIIQDFDIGNQIINRLKALGVSIYMDDFGKGYSSLGYLNQLPIDAIKIDRTFINQLTNRNLQRIIECVVSMGKDIGVRVIAEGVETSDQRDYLAKVGCDYGQGILFSKALDTGDFESFIKSII